ncbi:MAG: DNA phosphorothioation system sulfurtransferase DndC [Verrucomicrobiae bacterium]|nr:DNA phosphorothioation system sulfurtransferase DndC [Verrucomicrobiae bacterium]
MAAATYQDISNALQKLYVDDPRPWLVGFSGGKDSTLVAALVFDAVMSIPPEQRTKPVTVLCTDTRVEIPAIAEGVESVLDRMRRCSEQNNLNIDAHLLKPPPEQSFWVNIIGRGYPPPNRIFRWCTQRLKIDPVTSFVQKRMSNGRWSEAVLHLGARRAESSTRAETMAGRETRNGLNRHPDLPRVWVSNPIEFLTTEKVWAYLLQKPNPWGGDNRPLYKLYASAANGECPIQIDTSTPSCGPFSLSASTGERAGVRCRNRWTRTVVERDKASEGLLASGDERMESEIMSDWKETNRLRELQEQIAAEKGIRADTLRRLLAKVDEFSENHRAFGLPDDLLVETDSLQNEFSA